MGLHRADFDLTDAELARINGYFNDRAVQHAAEGEDAPSGVSVTFAFVPGFGRMVTARFDGATTESSISHSLC
jgi:hypothetical protein